jgi:DNA-cytosine methyltransferase
VNILATFDGMSCGLEALKRAGIEVTNYFASEIDKYCIEVAMKNHPEIIQLGDVENWRDWDLPEIDLVMGGSPCQGFSYAGQQLNFDDPRSKLFFDFVDIVRHYKPKYFLLENVVMKQEYQDIISQQLGVLPIEINSSLVSAQNRRRLYWTNIPNLVQPEDKGIVLKDVLQTKGEYVKVSKKGVYKKFQDKASCLTGGGHSGGNHSDMDLIGQINPARMVGRKITEKGTRDDYNEDIETVQYLEVTDSEKSHCITTVSKDSLVSTLAGGRYEPKMHHVGDATDIKALDSTKRIYAEYGKSPTLTTMQGGHRQPKVALSDYEYRRLTPVECERLQTLPDDYTAGVSNSQRYKMLGNGWTVDVISHILKNMGQEEENVWI